MKKTVFDEYETYSNETGKAIINYSGIVPVELLTAWEKHGFGSILKGYLRFINPDAYKLLLDMSYFRAAVSIPILVTAFGDIITWEENKYIAIIRYKYGEFNILSSGFDFFFEDLQDPYFLNKYFELDKYIEAVNVHGKPGMDECFGYIPLLGLGGNECVENIQIVKLKEHIELITQLVGSI